MGVNGIYGLSGSGLDIESMVKVGMMSKQNEYDKMAQKFTKNEWTKSAYLEINNSITTFNMSTLSQYKMSASMNAKTAESSSSAVKVEANASAPLVSHNVEVQSMSSNAYVISTASPSRVAGADSSSIKLQDTLFSSLTYNSTTKIASGTTSDGKSFSVDTTQNANAIEFVLKDGTKDSNNVEKSATISLTYEELANGATFNDLVTKISNSGLNIKASYDSVYDKFSVFNTQTGSENNISIELAKQDTFTGTKHRNITYTRTDTVTQDYFGNVTSTTTGELENRHSSGFIQQSKTYSEVAGSVTANFFNSWELFQSKDGDLYKPDTDIKQTDATSDYWKFQAAESGTFTRTTTTTVTVTTNTTKSNVIGSPTTTSATSTEVDTANNTNENYTNNLTNSNNTLTGTDAKIKIDGVLYDKVADNKITVNGITYTATKKTEGTETVTVSQDVDAIVDKVKSFVQDYNKLLASLYEKYDEKPETGYTPLTQTQKDQMKDEQIEKWEEKAKKGLLYHDQTLGKAILAMRNAISQPIEGVDGTYNSAYSIGISTTGLKGQLVLNEDKLRAALAADSDSVYNVFATLDSSKKDASGNVINNPDGNGFAQRLGDIFTDATKNIKTRAGSSEDITEDSDLNNLLRQLQTKMSNFRKMMNSFEDALYKKYDAMETALAKLGAQLNFVTGSFQQ